MTSLTPVPAFPTAVDSSMRSAFVSCPRSFYWQYLRSLRRPGTNIHLVFGGALARSLEVARKTFYSETSPLVGSAEGAELAGAEALIEAWGDAPLGDDTDPMQRKTLRTCLSAFQAYLDEYPLDSSPIRPFMVNGEPMVECSFAIPLNVAHPQTGEPILYCGRFDMIGVFNDALFVVDEKTTSMMGASWEKQFYTRAQMTGYCHGASLWGVSVAGCIIRGIGIYKAPPTIRFSQPIVYRPQWQIDEWRAQIERDVRRMVAAWGENYYDQNLDHSCGAYGGCGYLDLCTSDKPESWLDDYIVSPWDPMRIAEAD